MIRASLSGCVAGVLLLSAGSALAARNLALTSASEAGFRRVIAAAQAGALGDEIGNASVQIEHTRARVELVRRDGTRLVLLVTAKRGTAALSRYFDVAPGNGATRQDAQRLGRALDTAFVEDPFRVTGVEEPPFGEAIPSIAQAWEYDGWRAVLRIAERRMMTLPSLAYTCAVLVGLGLGCLASLWLLLSGAVPVNRRDASGDQSSSPRSPI